MRKLQLTIPPAQFLDTMRNNAANLRKANSNRIRLLEWTMPRAEFIAGAQVRLAQMIAPRETCAINVGNILLAKSIKM